MLHKLLTMVLLDMLYQPSLDQTKAVELVCALHDSFQFYRNDQTTSEDHTSQIENAAKDCNISMEC